MPAKITVEELLRRLKKIVEEGGETTIDWGKGDVYFVLSVTHDSKDPRGRVKLTVSMYDSTSDEMLTILEKYLEKVDMAVKGAEEGGAYANSDGSIADFYFRGRINIKVVKRPEIGTTFIIAVAR
jgi:hypothetical protein